MSKFALYYHGGSKNHGCEAIVRSTSAMIKNFCPDSSVNLFSYAPDDDIKADLEDISNIEKLSFIYDIKKYSKDWLKLYYLKRTSYQKADEYYYSTAYKNLSLDENDIYISVGGDTYCYGEDTAPVAAMNQKLLDMNKKLVLWGCSVGREDMSERKIEDFKRYHLICARESITYGNFQELGFGERLRLYPDPAFTLRTEKLPLPEGFEENNTVGLNISPLIFDYETKGSKGLGLRAAQNLIEYILKNTDMKIALIPHVVTDKFNDLVPLGELFDMYKSSGRLVFFNEWLTAPQLKGYIARCRFFIGARTHSTIAAYSSCVPTLVLGYSVKSKGIAKDIYGTDEGYVFPIQSFTHDKCLSEAFEKMLDSETEHRNILSEVMPKHIEKAYSAGKEFSSQGSQGDGSFVSLLFR